MASSSSSSTNSPCAACKFLRRKCMQGCIFAPYFPPEEPQKFANVHKIFGASNVTKLLNELLPNQREDAVNSLAYEAEARMKDPVYGCVGAISFLQREVHRLQKELDAANADLIRYACNEINNTTTLLTASTAPPGTSNIVLPAPAMITHPHPHHQQIQRPAIRSIDSEGVSFYPNSPFLLQYPPPWNMDNPCGDNNINERGGGGGGGGGGGSM